MKDTKQYEYLYALDDRAGMIKACNVEHATRMIMLKAFQDRHIISGRVYEIEFIRDDNKYFVTHASFGMGPPGMNLIFMRNR